MPAATAKSKLLSKIGPNADAIVKKHANDETKVGGFQNLPVGLKAVCKLMTCKFVELDKDTKIKNSKGQPAVGEFQFRAQAVIVEPEVFDKMKVKGRQVWLFEPVFDTKKGDDTIFSQEDHIANILNEMRKLGGDEYTKDCGANDLEALAKGLEELKPHFHFSTSLREGRTVAGKKMPDGVWENWNGCAGLEDYVGPDGTATGTEDSTGGETPPDDEPPADDTSDPVDIDAMVAAAESGEDENSEKLKEYAATLGIDGDTIDNADSWDAVKEMLTNGASGSPEDTVQEFEPEKGVPVKYAPPDLKDKTGKKRLKPVDCDVTAVNKTKKTADLKNLSNKALYKNVPWAELEAA
jgi:hypothetical protein